MAWRVATSDDLGSFFTVTNDRAPDWRENGWTVTPLIPASDLDEAVRLLRRWRDAAPSEALEDITDAFLSRMEKPNV